MREILSPLAGFLSPFWRAAAGGGSPPAEVYALDLSVDGNLMFA
jgi:hypothetical protein